MPQKGCKSLYYALLTFIGLLTLAGCQAQPSKSDSLNQANSSEMTIPNPHFDGDRAMKLLVQQCDFGPRPVGSPAHIKTRDFLLTEMKKYADVVQTQDFTYRGMPLTNIIGVFNPKAKKSILFCTHWDTRPTADEEIDPAKRKMPIPGADDGASGTAVLLEMARDFHYNRPKVGVILLLIDGEDYGDFEMNQGVFLGSRYFAAHHKGYDPEYGVLIDMIGAKNLKIHKEYNSQKYAPQVDDKVFNLAKEMGYSKYFIDSVKYNIGDDHLPLIQAGIPTIDLIDFDYAPWHTLADTPDKCSPQSLAIVGNVLEALTYQENPN
jgi:glutaminyl-peptide cyclotransferase